LPSDEEPACRFTCPQPPSTNNLFRNVPGKGRVRTRAYKQWIERAGWEVKIQRPVPVEGRVRMLIEGVMRIDVDNVKAIPDLAKKLGIIGDDRLVRDLRIIGADVDPGSVTVSIWVLA
jgi:Holliday junction resolvase RusA-like endonuclease